MIKTVNEIDSQSMQVNPVFQLTNPAVYECWRDQSLPYAKPGLAEVRVDIADPYALTAEELTLIRERCMRYNLVIYQLDNRGRQEKSLVHALGRQLSMGSLDTNLRADEDSVSTLEVREQTGNQYIPYTNKALSWHTDGYYNRLDKQIFGFILHCVQPAEEGGISRLLNPDQLYIALREENPAYIEALMHPQAMTIPENVESGKVIRSAQTGPVFMVRPDGRLHMRFSARKRNIVWRDTQETSDAVAMINSILADDDKVLTARLASGQGVICNNVLHNRTGFTDSEVHKRLMYRARYYGAVK